MKWEDWASNLKVGDTAYATPGPFVVAEINEHCVVDTDGNEHSWHDVGPDTPGEPHVTARAKRERIILNLPVGATREEWTRALDSALRFAVERIDKPIGAYYGSVYAYRDGTKVRAHWTRTRGVSVSLERGDE